MLKKVLHKAAKLTAALILTAGIFSGCSDALDVTAGKGTDAAESIRSVYKDECTSNPVCAEDMSSSASDGTWVRAYKTSNGQKVYHTSAPVYSSTVGGTYKFAITAGRWEVKLYRRFKGAESSSAFEFDVYGRRNADSDPQMSLKEINVFDDSGNSTGTSIFSTRTSLSKDYNNFTHIKTSALGRSSGWLEFKFDAESAAAGSDSLYFDNISFNKKDEKIFKISTSSSTAWSQTGKFQFKIDEALSGTKKVSFDLLPCSNATSLTVRGVDTTTKWIDAQKITNLNEWYHVEFTSTITAPGIGITVYISSKSTSQTVYIKNFKINDTAYTSLPASPYADSPAVINYAIVTKVEKEAEEPPVEKPINSKLKMLNAGPGKNCSTEMTVSWHSPTEANYIEYVTGDDLTVTFTNPKKVNITGTYRGSDRQWIDSKTNKITFYSCKAYLENLTPGTSYVYRVGNADGVSKPKKFKTAGTNGSFSFTWLADVHTASDSDTYRKNIKTVMSKTKDSAFVMFSGDLVDVGNLYHEWEYFTGNEFVTNYMVASIPGNHDYYRSDNGSSRYKRSYVSNKWWQDWAAVPKTNTSENVTLNAGNYWFLYNGVLFINIDSIENDQSEENYTNVSKQITWFKEVMAANKGKYNFVIVQQHFAYIINNEVKYGRIDRWSPVFQEYKVDLALGADSHEYSRSKPIYWDTNSSSVKAGSSNDTIYMTAFQLNGSSSPSTQTANSLCNKHISGGRGGCKIDVTKNSLTLTLISINKDGSVNTNADSVTIAKKSR